MLSLSFLTVIATDNGRALLPHAIRHRPGTRHSDGRTMQLSVPRVACTISSVQLQAIIKSESEVMRSSPLSSMCLMNFVLTF